MRNTAYRGLWLWGCMVFISLFISEVRSPAQTITGSVRGTVTEQSGAVVVGAAIQITNVNTGVVTNSVSDSAGVYSVQFLPVGIYKLNVTAPGFSASQIGPFDLQIDQTISFTVKLNVGETTTSVKVNAEAAEILNTQNATLGATISANTLTNLPNNGQNVSIATLFMPGAITTSLNGMIGNNGLAGQNSPFDTPSFNGNREQANGYILDGVQILNTTADRVVYSPAPAGLQEMRIITSNADAEYGNASGGEVIMVTRGGTNLFHGSLYGYLRNDNLDANSWANDFASLPKTNYTQTQFGATVGGPIIKNKLFFFADYEGFDFHSGGPATASVPTAQMRTGDFSQVLNLKGIQLYNTQNGFKPFVNNQIPINNPAAQYIFAHPQVYPLPNHSATDGLTQNNYVGYSKSINLNNQGDLRLDYKIGPRDSLMARFSQANLYEDTSHPVLPIAFAQAQTFPFQNLVMNYVHTFSASLVNEFRAGYMRTNGEASGVPADTTGLFGLNGDQLLGIPIANQPYQGFSEMEFSGSDATSIGNNAVSDTIVNNTIEYGDDIVWEHGKHITTFGVEFSRYQENYKVPGNSGALGQFTYSGQFTANPAIGGTSSAGFPFADFVLDEGFSAGKGGLSGTFGLRQWRDGYYAQDDWKIRSNLTLNIGLRYVYDQPYYEVHNKEVTVNLADPSLGTAGLELAGQNGNSRALYKPVYTGFMPRLGFAWQAMPRVVVRGGYGITDDMEGGGLGTRMTQNPPFETQFSEVASTPTGSSPGAPIRVENGFALATGSSTVKTTQYNIWSPNLRPAVIQQYNLAAQYLLNHDTSIQAGYVGQVGQHLLNWENDNQWPAPCTGVCTNAPFYNLIGQSGYLSVISSEGISNYNALQVAVQRRLNNGLESTINYTWSKSMTDAVGIFGVYNEAGTNGSSVYSQNAYNLKAEYGPAGYDARQNVTATTVYQLPFGRGKMFGSGWNRWTDSALGGWKLSGAGIFYSGFPITITSSNNANINSETARANQYLPLRIVHRTVGNWFGTDPSAERCSGAFNGVCAYGTELPNQFGTARIGTERGPDYRQVDLSAFKAFPIKDEQDIQFRADFFNAFNIASYSQPATSISTTTFGQITSTASAPRQIQLSVAYHF
jgi:hypothetical protein